MRKDIKEAWIADLLSGEYKQAQHRLRAYIWPQAEDISGPLEEAEPIIGHCCLGVLACTLKRLDVTDLGEGVSVVFEDTLINVIGEGVTDGNVSVLPHTMLTAIGLDHDVADLENEKLEMPVASALMALNDNGKSFTDIAAYIKDNVKED